MKLYFELFKLVIRKFLFRQKTGVVIRKFSEKMGIVYIKLAQILATQNYGNLFTEEDRKMLSSICDSCNPIDFSEIEKILQCEYGSSFQDIFSYISHDPVGSASVSQVHKAVLTTGETVAIKIKRKDVTKTMTRDIERIRKLVHRFGKIVKFNNYMGGDHALNLYLEWIRQETDFRHEMENIKTYQEFASNVNGKVSHAKKIKVPKVYETYCTDQVIVMEFVESPTINKMPLHDENKKKIVTALNSYLQLSFWALFHDQKIVFHGDPHSGNVCVDEEGNLCFLDMGLLCALSESEAILCRDFFLAAYSGNYMKLYHFLISYGNMDEEKKRNFLADCKKYCETVREKEVTYYFIDMINICLNYEFVPSNFLFRMAKAFMCLNGIGNFSNNRVSAKELLYEQTMEFLISRSFRDCKEVFEEGLRIPKKAIVNTLQNGLVNTMSKLLTDQELNQSIKKTMEHVDEILNLIKSTNSDFKSRS